MATQKEKLIAEALKLVEKGQYERAVKVYLKVVDEDKSDVRIWLKIGDLYSKLRRNAEAAETYQHVARAYSEQGFYTKAIAVYKQILKLDPSLVKVHEHLADLYKQMGLLPDAIEQYTHVAGWYQREGKMREALNPLKQMVELEPQNTANRVKLAELFSREHMVREAIDEFAKAAEYLQEQGKVDEYMKVAERLLFHSPDNRPVSRELARLYLQKGDARRALPRLQVCFKADPRDGETLGLLAEAFQALGQTVKAISVLKELARIFAENGNLTERNRAWRRVLELDPNDAEARASLTPSSPSLPRPDLLAGAPPQQQQQPPPPRSVIVSDSLVAASPFTPPSSPRLPTQPPASTPPSQPRMAPPPSSPDLEVDTSRTVRSMPAFDLMLAAAAQAQRAEAPAQALDEREINKILAETEVFAKYNLHAKAIEHVQSIFERAPDHAGAHERLVTLFINSGRRDEALAELRLLAEQAQSPADEVRYLDDILSLMPEDSWAADRRAALRAEVGAPSRVAARAPEPVAEPAYPGPQAVLAAAELANGGGGHDGHDAHESHDGLHIEVELEDEVGDGEAPAAPALLAGAAGGDDDELGVIHVADDEFEITGSTTDEFAVVVDERPARAAAPASARSIEEEIEDRFGADLDDTGTEAVAAEAALDGDVTPIPEEPPSLSAHAAMAPELDPRTALADELEELLPSPARPPEVAAEAVAPPPAESVDNFDFSSFDDLSASLQLDEPAAASLRGNTDPGMPAVVLDEEEDGPTGNVVVPAEAAGGESGGGGGGGQGLADDLEEVDFYIAQGMLDEAHEALGRLRASHPDHPLVIEKLAQLEGPAFAEATIAVQMDDLLTESPAVAAAPPPPPQPVHSTSSARRRESTGVTRQSVEASVSADDYESHFDLGIGCKEMGLFDQAISEFKLASRDPAREVQCQQMIGLCYLAKGQTNEAVKHFKQGLYAEGIREDEELSLYYELGQAYQSLADRTEALYYFERIRKRKPRYRDIERRIEALSQPDGDGAAKAAAALPRK